MVNHKYINIVVMILIIIGSVGLLMKYAPGEKVGISGAAIAPAIGDRVVASYREDPDARGFTIYKGVLEGYDADGNPQIREDDGEIITLPKDTTTVEKSTTAPMDQTEEAVPTYGAPSTNGPPSEDSSDENAIPFIEPSRTDVPVTVTRSDGSTLALIPIRDSNNKIIGYLNGGDSESDMNDQLIYDENGNPIGVWQGNNAFIGDQVLVASMNAGNGEVWVAIDPNKIKPFFLNGEAMDEWEYKYDPATDSYTMTCNNKDGCLFGGNSYALGTSFTQELAEAAIRASAPAYALTPLERQWILTWMANNFRREKKIISKTAWAQRFSKLLSPDLGTVALGHMIDNWLWRQMLGGKPINPWDENSYWGEVQIWQDVAKWIQLDFVDDWCKGLSGVGGSTEHLIPDAASDINSPYGIPPFTVITIQGKRTEFTKGSKSGLCSFNEAKPNWFERTDSAGNTKQIGYLYELSWTIKHPGLGVEGLDESGNLTYKIILKGQDCNAIGDKDGYHYFQTKTRKKNFKLPPGEQDKIYISYYDPAYRDRICIEFDGWRYDGVNKVYPADCDSATNGNILMKNVTFGGDIVTPGENDGSDDEDDGDDETYPGAGDDDTPGGDYCPLC